MVICGMSASGGLSMNDVTCPTTIVDHLTKLKRQPEEVGKIWTASSALLTAFLATHRF